MRVAVASILLGTVAAPGAGAQAPAPSPLRAPLRASNEVPLTFADSALVGRILLAEDRRDSLDASIAAGMRHADDRLRTLTRRALGRIRDPRFAMRDSLPPLAAPPVWPEADWRLRYRALAAARTDCKALLASMRDANTHVRLRAIDLAGAPAAANAATALPPCMDDRAVIAELMRVIDTTEATWHAAAHATVSLARLSGVDAQARIHRVARHLRWQPRQYAARAALILADTALLHTFTRDSHDNVRETAIESLSSLVGHAADATYMEALGSTGAQVVRAAAAALKGSTRADMPAAALRAFERLVANANASEHDARVALLEAAGKTADDDRPPPVRVSLPADAVALALGADIRLRVTMAPTSGGGAFTVRLRGDVAPMMAARMLALTREGYFDRRDWHRVEADFVAQGLSPGSNEYVGYRDFLRDELGTVPHVRGTLGMSTRGHDTGDAQWFINVRDNLRLNRDYSVWAEVVDGMGVVDAILEGDIVERVSVVLVSGASSTDAGRIQHAGRPQHIRHTAF